MEAVLDAIEREQRGKNEARRLRASGRIPAVVYDRGQTQAIAVDPKGLARILRTEQGANTLIKLNVPGGAEARVLVKEYQLDPVTHELLHADFYRVAMDKLIRVQVNVIAQGEPKGVKQQGGVLDIVHRQIEIECLPADIPTNIEVDVSEMMVGQSIRVKDITTNPKWKACSDPEMMVLHVIIPRVEEEPAAAEATAAAGAAPAAPAEPEVIKKGKKEEESAEATPAPAAGKKEKK